MTLNPYDPDFLFGGYDIEERRRLDTRQHNGPLSYDPDDLSNEYNSGDYTIHRGDPLGTLDAVSPPCNKMFMGGIPTGLGPGVYTYQHLHLPCKDRYQDKHLVYLAGPMSGIEYANAPAFAKAAERLREMGHLVWSPSEADISSGLMCPDGTCTLEQRHEVLRKDIAKIVRECHAVVAIDGWEKSRGARMEMAVALECGLQVGVLAKIMLGVTMLRRLTEEELQLLKQSFGS